MAQSQASKSLLGRGVVIAFPLIVIALVVMVLFMILPTRYHFQVKNGDLGLWVSRFGWLDAQQSRALDLVPVGNADFRDLTTKSFGTEGDAITALNAFVVAGIEDRKKRIYPLEKQIQSLYADLVGYLHTAGSLGLQDGRINVEGLRNWLDHQGTKEWQEYMAGGRLTTGSETFPYEMVNRPSEMKSTKPADAKKAVVQATVQHVPAQAQADHESDSKAVHK